MRPPARCSMRLFGLLCRKGRYIGPMHAPYPLPHETVWSTVQEGRSRAFLQFYVYNSMHRFITSTHMTPAHALHTTKGTRAITPHMLVLRHIPELIFQNCIFEQSHNFLKQMCQSRNKRFLGQDGLTLIDSHSNSLSHDGAWPALRLLMQRGYSADARWSERKTKSMVRVTPLHAFQPGRRSTCFSTRVMIAYPPKVCSAEFMEKLIVEGEV